MGQKLTELIRQRAIEDDVPLRLIRLKQVIEAVGLQKSAIYKRIAAGEFPKPISLGGRSVAWLESDIDAWIREKVHASRELV